MPPVSVAAYTLNGSTWQAVVAIARASAVRTSEEELTARGAIRNRPASCSSARCPDHQRVGDQHVGLQFVEPGDDVSERGRGVESLADNETAAHGGRHPR